MRKYTPRFSIEELAQQQRVTARPFDELLGNFWPEDESVDELISFVRESRHSDFGKRVDIKDVEPAVQAK